MFGRPKKPLDTFPYKKAKSSRLLNLKTEPGNYVYVVDIEGKIHVAPDDSHMHPRVLGGCSQALYAGDLTIAERGMIGDLTNLSGSFRFKSQKSLREVAKLLIEMGFVVEQIIWHDFEGIKRPRRLTV